MADIRHKKPHTYTAEERIALVTEIDRRQRAGEGTRVAIAAALGTSDTNYYNWVKSGIEPASASLPLAVSRIYSSSEREKRLSEVELLRRAGESIASACRQVGISGKSYRRWKADLFPSPVIRPVEVTSLVPLADAHAIAASVAETLVLHAPGGYRIEGLAIESAAALLRALA